MFTTGRSDIIHLIQRRVGYAGAVACGGIAFFNMVGALVRDGGRLLEIVGNPAIWVLVGLSAVAYLTTIRDSVWLRLFQVSIFIVYSYVASISIEPESLHGALFGIYGLVLSMQYGFLQRRFWIKISVVAASYAAIRMVRAAEYEFFLMHAAPAVAILVGLFVYLFWIIFAEEIHAYSDENEYLKAERDKNKVFVKFGRNISGVVHNLKSTLMSVDGCIDVLRSADESDREELLEIQKSSTTKMLKMINNFMTAVRSYQRTERRRVSLNELVESSIEVLRGNNKLKHKLKIDLDLASPDLIVGAPMELMQVIDNLVTNAAEAMQDTGRYTLTLTTRYLDGNVRLSVADQGVGIEQCEACETGDCTKCPLFAYGKSTKPDGAGIGMMYVRRILLEMGGSLKVDSTVGVGTTMHLYLPACVETSGSCVS